MKRRKAKPSRPRARSAGDRAATIVKALSKRLGIKGKATRKTKVRGKSALAMVKGRKTLAELVGTEPGEKIRKALGGGYAANVRVKIGGEWLSLSALTESPDRLGRALPKRSREILAGKESPKAKVINREARLKAPIVTAVEVYVTKAWRKPKQRTKAELAKLAKKAIKRRKKRRRKKRGSK